jgi:hypothetical protein
MGTLALLWGILAVLGLFIGFIPCLGSLNWLNIPFAVVGAILCVIAAASAQAGRRGSAIGGLVLCLLAIGLGLVRLMLGGGIL